MNTMSHSVVIFIIVLTLFVLCKSHNILVVVPTPSVSHQVVFYPLTQELAKRGHQVTFVTTDPAFPKGRTPANLTEIDVHDISYKLWIEKTMGVERGKSSSQIQIMENIIQIVSEIFEAQLSINEFKNAVTEKKYDLLILEGHMRGLVLSHILKIPVILMSSLGAFTHTYEMIGAPIHPILYPSPFRQRLYNLTMWEKITEMYNEYKLNAIEYKQLQKDNEMIRRIFGPDIPDLFEMLNNVDMVFENVHPIFEGNRPVPPGVVYIWGIHRKPRKELPQDLKSYLDKSKNGVIYMSFGSHVDPTLLPPEKLQMFKNVFSKLPYDVLWKWNGDELPGRPNNVRIEKWLPQSDLLDHPKVKLFITHGGLQSIDEAIQAHVPLVGIPLFTDSWYNVEKLVHFDVAIKVDWESMTEDKIEKAIHSILNDDRYRKNIAKLDVLMRDEPMDGLQRAVWWTEYVLRHSGARHLRSPAANISWAQYLELPLIAVLLSLLLALIIVTVTIIKIVFNKFALKVHLRSLYT